MVSPAPALPVLLVARSAGQLPGTIEVIRAYCRYPNIIGVPVSTTSPTPFDIPPGITALILTSPNSLTNQMVRALTHLPVYAVGSATADAARAEGFNVRYTGVADAAHMAEALRTEALQHFLHLHASNAGTDWYPTLQAAGHVLSSRTAYITTSMDSISPDTLTKLRQTPPTHALVFSRGGANSLKALLERHNLPWPPATVVISAYTGHGLPGNMRVASSPNLSSMLKCLP